MRGGARSDRDSRLEEHLAAWVASEGELLVQEALGEARALVKAALVKRFSDALMAEAENALARPAGGSSGGEGLERGHGDITRETSPRCRPARSHRGHRSTPSEGVYVYALIEGDDSGHSDIGGSTRLVADAGITALVKDVQVSSLAAWGEGPPGAGSPELLAALEDHDATVAGVSRRCAVIPMRFGTVFGDDEALREFISDNRDTLYRTFQKFQGRREWLVKVVVTAGGGGDPGGARPGAVSPGSGRSYIEAKQAALVQRRARRDEIAGALSALASDLGGLCDAQEPPVEAVAGVAVWPDVTYLVSREQEAAFAQALEEWTRTWSGLGLKAGLAGPHAPYHFVPHLGGVDDARSIGR